MRIGGYCGPGGVKGAPPPDGWGFLIACRMGLFAPSWGALLPAVRLDLA